jgi:hypothetical protein
MRFRDAEQYCPLRGTEQPVVERPIVGNDNQVFCCGIRGDLPVFQLA